MSSPLDDLAGEISVDKLAEGFPPTVHRYGVLVSHTRQECPVSATISSSARAVTPSSIVNMVPPPLRTGPQVTGHGSPRSQ